MRRDIDSPHHLPPSAVVGLRTYIEAGERLPGDAAPHPSPLRRLVPRALIPRGREVVTDIMRPVARRKVARNLRSGQVRLHIGSGFTYREGWTNIDLLPVKVDVPWNLRRGIPYPDGSAEAIAHEHLLEHLPLGAGYSLLRECLRVLAPGRTLRVGVPDAGACLASYAGRTDPEWANSAPTPMVSVLRLFYEHGHAAMFDGQTLIALCLAAGFSEAERFEFGGGVLGYADSPQRREGTLYVEATKAAG